MQSWVARMEDEKRNQDCETADRWEMHSNKNGR